MNRSLLLGILLILSAGTLWGAMGTAVQFLFLSGSEGLGLTPLGLVTLRQLCAGSLFVATASLFIPKRMWSVWRRPGDLRDIAVSGVIVFCAHYTFFESIYWSNAGTGAILLTTVPLFCGLWQAVRERRMVSRIELACFLLATAGVLLIVTDGEFEELKFSPLALAWGLTSLVFAAAYSIQPLAVIRRAGVVPVVAWGLLAGGLVAAMVCRPWTLSITPTPPGLVAFGFIVLFGTIAAFTLYMIGLKHVSPVVAGLLNCAEPLSAFLFSIALLGDRFGMWQTAGVALVLANVVLLALGKRGGR